jgi:hypothetical protein
LRGNLFRTERCKVNGTCASSQALFPRRPSSRCSMQPFQGREAAGMFVIKVYLSSHFSTSPNVGVMIAQLRDAASSEGIPSLNFGPRDV